MRLNSITNLRRLSTAAMLSAAAFTKEDLIWFLTFMATVLTLIAEYLARRDRQKDAKN